MILTNKNKAIYSFLCLILAFLVETYVVIVEHSTILTEFSFNKFMVYFSFKHYIMFLVVFIVIFYILLNEDRKKKVLNFIYKYRFPLSALIIAICVIFQIHGSSINELNVFNVKHDILFGISRQIRADEFNVNTMLAFSQYHNNFSYFSDIVRAAPTDMFILYGQAVWDIGIIFKPFLIGYLFLSPGQGLSFFWVSRLIVLFLVTFEFGKLITNDNKRLSVAYALLITFSPLIQWWFAINGLVEQLIFGQMGVLLINYYMTINDYRKRILIALSMIIVIGGFGFVFYPSWQIPFGYVFILLAIWIFLKRRKEFAYNKKDLLIIISSLAILSLLVAHILLNSMDTIKILMNTVYPGNEVFNGMGDITYFLNYVPSIFFAMKPEYLTLNVVDTSAFVDFFPVPIILACIVLFYQKTKDKLLYGLLALYLIFIFFYIVPLPDFIVDITLRSHIRNIRLYSVIGFISCLLLIRSIADLKDITNKKLVIIFSIILSIIVVYLSMFSFDTYYLSWMPFVLVAFYAVFFSIIFLSADEKGKKIFLIACIVLAFLTGALANPIDSGVDVVYESNYMHEVQKIVESDPDGQWIVTDLYFNSLLPAGAKTINSINTYPDLDRWHSIDPNNQYEDVYNRYAHIAFVFKNDTPTEFALASVDIIHIYLNVNDLEKLGVDYIATPNDLNQFSNENMTFNIIYQEGPYKIYHINYNH